MVIGMGMKMERHSRMLPAIDLSWAGQVANRGQVPMKMPSIC